jgi:hypothetical protein
VKKAYTCIAYSIGRGINQRREIVGADPLPDRLLDLLRTLRERDDQNSEGAVSMTREEKLIGERAS